MQNSYLTPGSRAFNTGSVRSHVGSNVNRQTRHNARADRRRGNWNILGVDTALLWAVDACLADTDDDPMCAELPAAGLRP